MTTYTGEASTKQKLKGIADGLVAAITQRLPHDTVLEGLPKFQTYLKTKLTEVCDLSEEGEVDPKKLVAHIAEVNDAVTELLGKLTPQEPKMIGLCVRNLVTEAHALGKGK